MATYLLRFDDVCPAMNWDVWERIELGLDELGIRPLVAVVPDNRDDKLAVSAPRADFWERVRSWQARGWTIGLHGYQHVAAGAPGGILGPSRRSEFTGLSAADQEQRLRRATAIFSREGVEPTVWVAPWHSFDETTLSILPAIGIRLVSDGPGLYPHEDRSMLWFPQQLWRFKRIPLGVLTVCHHVNAWSVEDTDRWLGTVRRLAPRIGNMTVLSEVYAGKDRSRLDRALWGTARLGSRVARLSAGTRQRAESA
jgi:predicted deacetylase